MMEIEDLRPKTTDELETELVKLRKEHLSLRMQRASEQLPQTHLLGETKRDIARVKTLIREKQDV